MDGVSEMDYMLQNEREAAFKDQKKGDLRTRTRTRSRRRRKGGRGQGRLWTRRRTRREIGENKTVKGRK